MGPLVGGRVEPLGPLGQGLLELSGVTVVGQLKQGLVSIAPKISRAKPAHAKNCETACFSIFYMRMSLILYANRFCIFLIQVSETYIHIRNETR